MNKLLGYIFAFMLFGVSVVQAAQLDFSLYLSDYPKSSGVRGLVTGGEVTLLRGGVNLSPNLGGPDLAIGRQFKDFKVFLGVSAIVIHESQSVTVPVQGVPITTETRGGNGETFYIEVEYKRVFLRYARYNIESDFIAVLYDPSNVFIDSVQGTVVEEDNVLWLGYVFPW